MSYAIISPCRNEQDYMRRTLDSVVAQSARPDLWVIVDDGSTDSTPQILAEYADQHDWIHVVSKPDRGHRAVGPGVIEAFYFGLNQLDIDAYEQICKLDLDLDLPPRYFETLIARMEAEPRIGSCSGKAYFRTAAGELKSEGIGDEMSVGAAKFYRVRCFKEIGGFAREVMWDGIDCHKSRQLGWIACSWDTSAVTCKIITFGRLRVAWLTDQSQDCITKCLGKVPETQVLIRWLATIQHSTLSGNPRNLGVLTLNTPFNERYAGIHHQ